MPYFSWAHHHNPYSYHAHRAAFFLHRGPRRFLPKLFWLGIGAGAYAMWSKHAGDVKRLPVASQAIDAQRPSRTDVDWPAEKIRDVGQQAGTAMADISESALDRLSSGLQALRARLAETRAQQDMNRDNDKLYLEHRISADEDRRNQSSTRTPHRFV